MRSITDVIRQFKLNWTEQLDAKAITAACQDAQMSWIQSTLNPIVTIQIFFLQILHGNTACEHLSHLARIPFTAAAYCKARMRLKLGAVPFCAPFSRMKCGVRRWLLDWLHL